MLVDDVKGEIRPVVMSTMVSASVSDMTSLRDVSYCQDFLDKASLS